MALAACELLFIQGVLPIPHPYIVDVCDVCFLLLEQGFLNKNSSSFPPFSFDAVLWLYKRIAAVTCRFFWEA